MQAFHRKEYIGNSVLGKAVTWAIVIAGLALSAVPRVRGEEVPDGATYAQFWEEKIKPAKGDVFLHSSRKPKVGLSPQVVQKVQEVMQSQAGKAVRAGKLRLDATKKLALQNSTTHGYTRALLEEEVLKEFSDRATEGFQEFLEYVGRPDLMPKLEFRLLDENTEFEGPNKESALMYLAWNRKIRVSSKMHYHGQREVLLAKIITFDDSVRGQLVGVFTGRFDEKEGVSLRNVLHHAYGGVGYSAISSYAVPMSELFPISLREMCAARVNKEINEAWMKKGRPVPLRVNDYQPIITKWDVREDSLVEALIDEFIGSKLDELGFTKEDWVHYCRHGNSSQYALSPAIKKKIKMLGAPELLRLYIEEPESLFEK